MRALGAIAHPTQGGASVGEPTMPSMVAAGRKGDTVHIDVIDKRGNMIAATHSGGWLPSSPVIPELGFPLNSRAQMFWLEDGLPSSLAPGKRPRTTLTPSIAFARGKPCLLYTSMAKREAATRGKTLRFAHHSAPVLDLLDLCDLSGFFGDPVVILSTL